MSNNKRYQKHIASVFQLLALMLSCSLANAYEFRSACGEISTQPVTTSQALLLIGGGEAGSRAEKPATAWLLEHARGGDYLVLRAGGTGKQASWACKHFGQQLNSAAELSVDSREDANDPVLVNTVRHAEIIFIAGGDQNKYEDNWKGTDLAQALNEHLQHKPIAGSSAGMAILGQSYYSPADQGMTGSEILNDPYHRNSNDINHGDFLLHPWMRNTITDTHLNRRLSGETRHARLLGLLARTVADQGFEEDRYGIGLEEGTFLAVDKNGLARVYGKRAYLIKSNGLAPENIQPQQPLIWNRDGKAVSVYTVKGDKRGRGELDLSRWQGFSGGQWQYWYTDNGYRAFACKKGC